MLEGKLTLEDFLEADNISDFDTVRIGTVRGTGWIFVGEPTEDNIRAINRKVKHDLRMSVVTTEEHIKALEDLIKNFRMKPKGHYTRGIAAYKNDLDGARKRLEKKRDALNNYGDIRKREVKSFYVSDINANTLCLIVEGIESGNEETEWDLGKELNMSGCYNILETIYKDAAAEYEEAYMRTLKRPRDKKAKEKLEEAERFFKKSPLVDWSGTDGEEAMATIRMHVNSRPSTKRIKARHKALEHHNKKSQDTTRYYDENFKFSFKQIIWDAFGEQDKTLKEIALDMGVSNGYLSSLRSGNSIPRDFSPRLKELCDYLGCTEEMKALYNTR